MTFQVVEPVLVIGRGGAGSKLSMEMKETLNADYLRISNDKKDLDKHNSIHISTKSIINPSTQMIRGCALEYKEEIAKQISQYETIIIMANLAVKAGASLSTNLSSICK